MPATLRSFTDFILQSLLRTFAVAFALTFIPLVGSISIVIAAFITLRKGTLPGFWILIAATLPYLLLLPFQPMPVGLWVVGIIAISNIFTWAFAVFLNRYHSWNLILEVAALIGIIAVTSVHLIKPDIEVWWGQQLNAHLSQMISGEAKTTPAIEKTTSTPVVNEDSMEPDVITFISVVKPYVSGIITASILFTALLQIFIARWWQTSLVNPDTLRVTLRSIRLGHMAGLVFLTALILSYLKIPLAQDMLPVLYLVFCIAGLSLVHYGIAKTKGLGWLWLTVFYSTLLCSWMVYHLPLGFQLVAMAALIDVWFDGRGYIDRRFP